MVETSPSHGGDFKCLEVSLSPWNKAHETWTKCGFMSPICSKIGRGWTRDPFNGTWDFRMSFLVSLPVTFLVYGNSRKLQNIWHIHLNLRRFQDSVENFMFLSHTAQRPLLPLGLAIPEKIQRHEMKNRLAVCWKKSCQFTWWTCVSTAPSSDHLSIFTVIEYLPCLRISSLMVVHQSSVFSMIFLKLGHLFRGPNEPHNP